MTDYDNTPTQIIISGQLDLNPMIKYDQRHGLISTQVESIGARLILLNLL
jgi:hypothetical protein